MRESKNYTIIEFKKITGYIYNQYTLDRRVFLNQNAVEFRSLVIGFCYVMPKLSVFSREEICFSEKPFK